MSWRLLVPNPSQAVGPKVSSTNLRRLPCCLGLAVHPTQLSFPGPSGRLCPAAPALLTEISEQATLFCCLTLGAASPLSIQVCLSV